VAIVVTEKAKEKASSSPDKVVSWYDQGIRLEDTKATVDSQDDSADEPGSKPEVEPAEKPGDEPSEKQESQ